MKHDIQPDDVVAVETQHSLSRFEARVIGVYASHAICVRLPEARKAFKFTLVFGVDWWEVVQRDGQPYSSQQHVKVPQQEARIPPIVHAVDDEEAGSDEESGESHTSYEPRARPVRGRESKRPKVLPRRHVR